MFQVVRHRSSVTQGEAEVFLNRRSIVRYGDTITPDGQHYVIDGWGSIHDDDHFIAAAKRQYPEKCGVVMGMRCDVFRAADLSDCTNDGVTSRHTRVTLIGEGVEPIFAPSEDAPALKLVRRHLFGREYLHAEPLDRPAAGHVGWMFGGNFIFTSDSRFPSPYPIPVHDRQESRE